MKKLFAFLAIAIAVVAYAQTPVPSTKVMGLSPITNAELNVSDQALIYQAGGSILKRMSISEMDSRWLGAGGSFLYKTGDTMTGGMGLNYSGVTASTVPYLNSNRRFTSSTVTPTELSYLSGAVGPIQAQIDGITGVTGNFVRKTGDTMSGGVQFADAVGTAIFQNSALNLSSNTSVNLRIGSTGGLSVNTATGVSMANVVVGDISDGSTSANQVLRVSRSQNGSTFLTVKNADAGSGAFSTLSLNNDVSSARIFLGSNAAGNTLTIQPQSGVTGGVAVSIGGATRLAVSSSGAVSIRDSLALSGSSSGQTRFVASATAAGSYIYPSAAPTSAGDSFLSAVSGASSQMSWREWRAPTVTRLNSTGSQLYTLPSGVRYLEIEMIGGGGGGGPASNVSIGAIGGLSAIINVATATGGGGGDWGITGATGGVFTIATSSTVIDRGSTNGGYGNPGENVLATDYGVGGNGCSSVYGGAGGGGGATSNGLSGVTTSGSGGGGAGLGGPGKSGAGGGCGAWVRLLLTNPSSTYSIVVGAGGAGASGAGSGAQGRAIITEHYQ